MPKFKSLVWKEWVPSSGNLDYEAILKVNSELEYYDALNAEPLYEHLSISRQRQTDVWMITAQYETEWETPDLSMCMTLDPAYTLQEVKDIVQTCWETRIIAEFFE